MDHQGSVESVTDANQKVLLRYSNDVFGRQIVAPTGTFPNVPNDLQFQSNWLTVTIGTRRYGISPSRVHDPELGRFLERDPFPTALKVMQNVLNTGSVGNSLGIYDRTIFHSLFRMFRKADFGDDNLFVYAYNNMLKYVDPFGMPCIEIFKDPVTITEHGIDYTFTANDLNYATALIYSEAKNDPEDQYAVASVLLNRIGAKGLKTRKDRTLRDVIDMPNQFAAIQHEKFHDAINRDPCDWDKASRDEYNSAAEALKKLLGPNKSGLAARYDFNEFLSYKVAGWTQVVPGGNYYHNNPGIVGPLQP